MPERRVPEIQHASVQLVPSLAATLCGLGSQIEFGQPGGLPLTRVGHNIGS
jgi:hypothetical protein